MIFNQLWQSASLRHCSGCRCRGHMPGHLRGNWETMEQKPLSFGKRLQTKKNDGASPCFMGKSTISFWPFSIASCMFTRGSHLGMVSIKSLEMEMTWGWFVALCLMTIWTTPEIWWCLRVFEGKLNWCSMIEPPLLKSHCLIVIWMIQAFSPTFHFESQFVHASLWIQIYFLKSYESYPKSDTGCTHSEGTAIDSWWLVICYDSCC